MIDFCRGVVWFTLAAFCVFSVVMMVGFGAFIAVACVDDRRWRRARAARLRRIPGGGR